MDIPEKFAELEARSKELAAQIITLKAASAKSAVEHAAQLAALKASHAAELVNLPRGAELQPLNLRADALAAEVAKKETAIAGLKTQIESLARERDEFLSRAKKAERYLNSPEFADAAAQGVPPVSVDNGGGSDLWAEYLAIKDQTARAKFYEKHADELDRTAEARGGLTQ
ncbi:MAG: hypothetical protein NTY53_18585 [Kiritimatiellaeota bacterium]|nr:hypothetical protein [Kiritimatiellota bacterium]